MGQFTYVTQKTKNKELSKEENAMKKNGSYAERGASVMEILSVLAVIAIVVTFAVSQFGRTNENFQRQNVSKEFKSSLERARFDSVKRRASNCTDMSRVVLNSSTSYTLYLDNNQDGQIETATEGRTVDFSGTSNVTMGPADLTYPQTIRFDQRGLISMQNDCAQPQETTTPKFEFCQITCSGADSTNSDTIFISPTGTVAMMPGGDDVPSFDAPNVANITANQQIDNRLTVWTGTPPTPTPFPTTTPATPTPLPSVSVDPSASPTPTPTPTPASCDYGDNPYTKPCSCLSPMYIKGDNGKNPRCVGVTPTPTP